MSLDHPLCIENAFKVVRFRVLYHDTSEICTLVNINPIKACQIIRVFHLKKKRNYEDIRSRYKNERLSFYTLVRGWCLVSYPLSLLAEVFMQECGVFDHIYWFSCKKFYYTLVSDYISLNS